MTIRQIAIAAVAMALVVQVQSALGGLITYTQIATGSGSLGGTSFTNAVVTITAIADTADIILSDPSDRFYKVTNESTTVDVAGLGSATFTDAIYTGVVQLFQVAGFSDPKSEDILDTQSPAFSTYNLSTSIGPLAGTTVINPGFSFPTTAGDFIFNSANANDSTFQATLGTASIPEPSSLILASTAALAGLGVWRSHRVGR
jgi:heme A synthase